MQSGIEIVQSFAALEGRIVTAFLEKCSPRDMEYFKDVANGTLAVDSVEWSHVRHGNGVRFVASDGRVVDVHYGLADSPTGISAWRLLLYAESIEVERIAYDGQSYAADNEQELEELLVRLRDAGVVREVKSRLYEIVPARLVK